MGIFTPIKTVSAPQSKLHVTPSAYSHYHSVCINKLITLRSLWSVKQAVALRWAFIAINHFIWTLVENQANKKKKNHTQLFGLVSSCLC